MRSLSAQDFRALTIAISEFQFEEFSPSRFADVMGCHYRTAKRRIESLKSEGFLEGSERSFSVRENADLGILDSTVEALSKSCPARKMPHAPILRIIKD